MSSPGPFSPVGTSDRMGLNTGAIATEGSQTSSGPFAIGAWLRGLLSALSLKVTWLVTAIADNCH